MGQENKIAALSTTIAMTVSVLAVLIGSGIGWGMIQVRVEGLEAKAATLRAEMIDYTSKKVNKETYYKDIEQIHIDLREIQRDIKAIMNYFRDKNH